MKGGAGVRDLMLRLFSRRPADQGRCTPEQLAYAQRESA